MKSLGPALAVALTCAATFNAKAGPIDPPSLPPVTQSLKFSLDTIHPYTKFAAYKTYCATYHDCDANSRTPDIITLTPKVWSDLVNIHAAVRDRITFVEDFNKYEPDPNSDVSPDVWTRAEDGRGDCEDYVLAWDLAFRAAGYPRSALLKTIMSSGKVEIRKSPEGDKEYKQSHMVLSINTDRGVFIADSGRSDLYPLSTLDKQWTVDWVESPFNGMRLVKASPSDPNISTLIASTKKSPSIATAGIR